MIRSGVKYIFKEAQNIRTIIAGGTNKQIIMWHDSEDYNQQVDQVTAKLPHDIQVLEFCPPSTSKSFTRLILTKIVAAGLDDGSIFLLDYQTCDIRLKVKPDRNRRYDQYDTFHKKPKYKYRDPMNPEMLVEEKFYIEDVIIIYFLY
jgi:WD40 repeat protein